MRHRNDLFMQRKNFSALAGATVVLTFKKAVQLWNGFNLIYAPSASLAVIHG